MPFAVCEDSRIEYEVRGQGRPLVLLHGTGQTARETWQGVLRKFEARGIGRRIVLVNYSGSGNSEDDGHPLTLPGLARQVLAAADAAGLDKFDLAGHSLGACVALQAAADFPERVRKAALLAGFASAGDGRLQFQFNWWKRLALTSPADLAALFMYTCFSPAFLSRLGADKIAGAVKFMAKNGNWVGAARQIDLDLRLDLRETAAQVRPEVLLIDCLQDFVLPGRLGRELAEALPASRHAELDAGHAGAIEQPGRLVELLDEFFG
ncbi:MAG: alpha/beta hydrolase [Deltaproteobacteria bacterium]|jgi:pimeloyl-ACP methyl ester carboxylesterase|nr:alpha/beta hydrolase [Deltaproteobacteria bacterium]